MKRVFILLAFFFLFVQPRMALARQPYLQPYKIEVTPIPCSFASSYGMGDCPKDLKSIYNTKGEPCVSSYDEFIKDPLTQHFWVLDPQITAQGKADERARQFIYWAVTHPSIDNHPTLFKIWSTTRNVAFFFVLFIVAIMGLGMIIDQRSNFSAKIKIWPSIVKIMLILLYISFSAAIVILLIQMADIIMKFFIETLGGRDLFNIYFSAISREGNYLNFIGCRDLNFRVQEGIEAELFLLKLTNITYYVMGVMLILRKILLWFLLFVSPFLALLMPFIFIRNTGWIWIGVFFQWLFYGPLFALFLGALATIWKGGIPFLFDFSRVKSLAGYIYPTGINIVYGGPGQMGQRAIDAVNNGNYIDTFTEYIISLLMLWAVTFFPWWLLRIFRDYCCEGIYAMKNILMSMYDQMRGGPTPQPPGQAPTPSTISTGLKIPREVEIPVKVKLETIEEIKKAKTEEINRSLNISATKLTDIAHFETNKQVRETVNRNLNFLANPTRAETPTERQKYMNIRSELFNRSIKEDRLAQRVLSSISTSKIEQMERRQELIKTVPQMVPVTQKIQGITSSIVSHVSANTTVVNTLAQKSKLQTLQVQNVLSSLQQNINQPVQQIVQKLSETSGLSKEKITAVIKEFASILKENKDIAKEVAQAQNINTEEVEKVIASQIPIMAEPEKHVEETIAIPPTVSLEDYEQVKRMWAQQYEKGEVPVTENIKSREQWLEQDIVFITNALNKLLSPNEELRQEGLDDISYILPIFLINNLKGEELVVYLKAKLEAAKAVAETIQKEKEIEAKLKAKAEEELVEVGQPKEKEKEKTMEMGKEIKIEEDKSKILSPNDKSNPKS